MQIPQLIYKITQGRRIMDKITIVKIIIIKMNSILKFLKINRFINYTLKIIKREETYEKPINK